MPKRDTPQQPRRAKSDSATIEVSKEWRRRYKVAAVHLDVTMRHLIEDALEAYYPQVKKRLGKAPE